MREFNYYESVYNEEKKSEPTIQMIYEDAISDISDILEIMDEFDVVGIFQELGYDICHMDELDDEFSHLTVTEILDGALSGIDTSDNWFVVDDARSSDDPWDLINMNVVQIAEEIFDRRMDGLNSEIDEIFDTVNEYEDELLDMEQEEKSKAKKEEIAKALFEKMISENIDEVISRLWN